MRRETDVGLSSRSRLILFSDTIVTAEKALELDESELTIDFLVANGVKPINILASGLGPLALKARGAKIGDIKMLGFDSLDLCNTQFFNELHAAYGTDDIKREFFLTAADAVCLAGSPAASIMALEPSMFFEKCCGFPRESVEVLKQLPAGKGLVGASALQLLDCGLRAKNLAECAYGLTLVVSSVAPTGAELAKLGYTV